MILLLALLGADFHVDERISEQYCIECRDKISDFYFGEKTDWKNIYCKVSIDNSIESGLTEFSDRFIHIKVNSREKIWSTHILPHEIAHAVIKTHYQQKIPLFIEEGMAQLIEPKKATKERIESFDMRFFDYYYNGVMDFKKYPYTSVEDTRNYYTTGLIVVKDLMDNYGKNRFRLFLDEGVALNDFRKSFVKVFEVSHKEYRRQLRARYEKKNVGAIIRLRDNVRNFVVFRDYGIKLYGACQNTACDNRRRFIGSVFNG